MDGEWIPAGELEAGDEILKADGTVGFVESLEIALEPTEMYNLTVEEAHTFFVGDGDWLVHNTCFQYGDNFYVASRDEAFWFAKDRAGIPVEADWEVRLQFYYGKPTEVVDGVMTRVNLAGRAGDMYVYKVDGEYKLIVEHMYNDAGEFIPHFHSATIPDPVGRNIDTLEDVVQYLRGQNRYTEYPNNAHIYYNQLPPDGATLIDG